MRVFYVGAPGPCGGANTEMGHTISLWRKRGIEVTVIPTWGIDDPTKAGLERIGCQVAAVGSPDNITAVPDLAGGVVMSMCNSHFFAIYPKLKELGCKTIWSNAMTFLFDHELNGFRQYGAADAYHFQSEFQQSELEKILPAFGYTHDRGHLIPGAFDFDLVPFAPRPHAAGEEFVVGRLARPDLDKWSSNHWPILSGVPYAGRKALAMGWNGQLTGKCGQAPAWAETLAPQAIPVADFLKRCHVMLGLNGGARENWPRIGLEAMAAGVPIVAQNLWGWREMIVDGVTGFLTNSDEEMKFRIAQLAYDEDLRQEMIYQGFERVQYLANEEVLGRQWERLLEKLGA